MGEFDLISRYFTPATYGADVLLGVGDDAAVLDVPTGYKLVAAVDTIVAGIHFPVNTSAADIAWRALAVNLSDVAAMGAIPRWFTLSLCMPEANESWLAEFAATLHELAARYSVQLVGGDTVKGPLNISIQVLGVVEANCWLGRRGATPGDALFVSGIPGEAAGGLRLIMQPVAASEIHRQHLLSRFYRPTPRVELGRALRDVASAAMDVSDGLLTDLRKLCAASGCGARLDLDALPSSSALLDVFAAEQAEQCTLHGGDDYELLFTVPQEKLLHAERAMLDAKVKCTRIGEIVAGTEVSCLRAGKAVSVPGAGFDHFAPG